MSESQDLLSQYFAWLAHALAAADQPGRHAVSQRARTMKRPAADVYVPAQQRRPEPDVWPLAPSDPVDHPASSAVGKDSGQGEGIRYVRAGGVPDRLGGGRRPPLARATRHPRRVVGGPQRGVALARTTRRPRRVVRAVARCPLRSLLASADSPPSLALRNDRGFQGGEAPALRTHTPGQGDVAMGPGH